MKKTIATIMIIFAGVSLTQAQVLKSKKDEVKVSFFSSTPIEDISALHSTSTSFIANDSIKFMLSNTGFVFPKPLMQEHFNENYMESTKFPKSDFKGKISNLADVDFSKDGMYKAKVTGNLTMHGVTQPATADAIITVKGGKISASSKFKVKLNDYKIERPAVVADKISDTIEISVDAAYEPKK